MTSSNSLFCATNTPKDIQFEIKKGEKKAEILHFKKLKPEKVWHFCLLHYFKQLSKLLLIVVEINILKEQHLKEDYLHLSKNTYSYNYSVRV